MLNVTHKAGQVGGKNRGIVFNVIPKAIGVGERTEVCVQCYGTGRVGGRTWGVC